MRRVRYSDRTLAEDRTLALVLAFGGTLMIGTFAIVALILGS